MELSFEVDGMVFAAWVRYDRDDDYFEITRLICDGQDASFLCDSRTLAPLINAAAWDAYDQECREMNDRAVLA